MSEFFTPSLARSLDIHVDLFLCWFRKIFNVETTIKKEFCKVFKAKIHFVAGDDTLCGLETVRLAVCVSVSAIFTHGPIEPIALTFSIETLAPLSRTDVEETRISFGCKIFRCKLAVVKGSTMLIDSLVVLKALRKTFLCQFLSNSTAAVELNGKSFVTLTAWHEIILPNNR